MKDIKTVIIVGAGFAGINAARYLAKNPGYKITIIDRRNHHLFQPLLYQVAMAALSPAEIAAPIRSIFSGLKNVDVLMGNVTAINKKYKIVTTDFGKIPYDYLILACGAVHSYFGHDEWEDFAPGLKSLEEATEIRRRVLTAFERAEREKDPEKQKELLSFVVVGGGPTGVELAGAIGEISRFTLTRDFRRIDPKSTRVILIEAGDRILPAFHKDLSSKATRDLEKIGVHVWTKSKVTAIDKDGVTLEKEKIRSRTVLWAAGVGPSELNSGLETEVDRQGRVVVEKDLSIPGHPDTFVIGDQACFRKEDGSALPGLAPVAIQQGRFAAKNIMRDRKGKPRKDFSYIDKGIMATIGRADAVLEVSGIRISGFIAWIMWLFVHIFYLIGFKNRVVVLFHWSLSYMTLKRGARLITMRRWKSSHGPVKSRKKDPASKKKPAVKKKTAASAAAKKSRSKKTAKK